MSAAVLGMNVATGAPLDGIAHIAQSIRDILTTRIGTRVMRRDYGSLVPELIDQPGNAATLLRLQAATATAIKRWEPRVSLSSVSFAAGFDGRYEVSIEATRRDGQRDGAPISLAVKL